MTPEKPRRAHHPRLDLCRRCGGPHSGPAPRPRGNRFSRRRGDDRAWPLEPRGSLPRDRFRHHRTSARHDDRGRASQGVRRIPGAWRARHRICACAVRPARHRDGAGGRSVGLSGQRRDLPRHDADRAAGGPLARPQSAALSGRGRDRLQLRQRRDDHRKPAEHGDRRRSRGFPIRRSPPRSRRSRSSASSRSSSWCASSTRQEFAFKGELEPHLFRGHMHNGQVVKASFVCVALAIAFFAGVPPPKAAILGGAFLPLHPPDQADAASTASSTGRCLSCSPACSSSSLARKRRC